MHRLFDRLRPATPLPVLSPVARRVKEERLTYLSDAKLSAIERALAGVVRGNVPGDFVECGVALGGSAIVIASWMSGGRAFHGYDVFGLIPPPGSEFDDEKSRARYEVIRSGKSPGIDGDTYYGYLDDLYARVVDTFARFGEIVDGSRIALHKGLFEETLQPRRPIAFAHIDCDWYDPVRLCLRRIAPHLPPGAHVVLDDYNDYGGCRRATDEFLDGAREIEVVARTPNLVFRRRASRGPSGLPARPRQG